MTTIKIKNWICRSRKRRRKRKRRKGEGEGGREQEDKSQIKICMQPMKQQEKIKLQDESKTFQ